MVKHSDPKYRNLFAEVNVGFRLEKAGLVNHNPFIQIIVFFISQRILLPVYNSLYFYVTQLSSKLNFIFCRYIYHALLKSNGF
jgi:hypothetical protein